MVQSARTPELDEEPIDLYTYTKSFDEEALKKL
jgi:hypothetical protein